MLSTSLDPAPRRPSVVICGLIGGGSALAAGLLLGWVEPAFGLSSWVGRTVSSSLSLGLVFTYLARYQAGATRLRYFLVAFLSSLLTHAMLAWIHSRL